MNELGMDESAAEGTVFNYQAFGQSTWLVPQKAGYKSQGEKNEAFSLLFFSIRTVNFYN